MKKAVSFILAIIIATGALPFTGLTAFAENTELTAGSCGENATSSFDSGTGTLTISGTGDMTTYASSSQSPFCNHSEINALVVEAGITSISDFAFVYCTGMESVSFPNTLEKIGVQSFLHCQALTDIVIPDSVIEMGHFVFADCSKLENATLSSSLTEIVDNAFAETAIKSVTIPSGVKKIDDMAFYNCENLATVSLPEGLTEIDIAAFSLDINLKNITMPSTITKIGTQAFAGCNSIEELTLPAGLQSISDSAFANIKYVSYVPSKYENDNSYMGLKKLTVLSTDCVFESSSGNGEGQLFPGGAKISCYAGSTAEAFAIGKNINYVNICIDGTENHKFVDGEEYCQKGCGADNPATRTYSGTYKDSISWVVNAAKKTLTLSSVNGSAAIPARDGITSTEQPWYGYQEYFNKIIIEEGITSIGDIVFTYYENVNSIELPESLNSIGESAFGYCTGLESLIIPSGVTELGDDAFYHCDSLSKLIILNRDLSISTATILDTATIYGYSGSTAQTFANNYSREFVVVCAEGTDNHLYALESTEETATAVTYKYTCPVCKNSYTETVEHYETGSCGDNATYSLNTNTGVITISGTGDMSNTQPWSDYLNVITEVVVEEGINNIGGFQNATNLKKVTLPTSAKVIYNHAFSWCSNLTDVDLGGATYINGSFMYCTSLSSIEIPDTCTELYGGTFEGCTNLTSVSLPDNMTSIGYFCFYNCRKLSSVTLPSKLEYIYPNSFYNCKSLTELTVPASVIEVYGYDEEQANNGLAFLGCSSLKTMTFLGAETTITDNEQVIPATTIRGKANSPAQAYAEKYSRSFVTICTDGSENHNFVEVEEHCLNGCGAVNPDYDSIYSGYCSDDHKAYWHYDAGTATLTITGTGPVSDGQPWSAFLSSIECVVIEDGITAIGANNFKDCTKLQSVTIPLSVTTVGNSAFAGCNSLRSITIPAEVSEIGESVFDGCTNLVSINYQGTMDNWNSLDVTQPKSVVVVSGDGEYKINEEDETKFAVTDNVLYTSDKSVLIKVIEEKDVEVYTVPSEVREITEGAFEKLEASEIVINDTVDEIGSYLFGLSPDDNIPNVIFFSGENTEIAANTLFGCESDDTEVIDDYNSNLKLLSLNNNENNLPKYLRAGTSKRGKNTVIYCIYNSKQYKKLKYGKVKTFSPKKIAACTYTGRQIRPGVEVYDARKNKTISKSNYRAEYGKNLNVEDKKHNFVVVLPGKNYDLGNQTVFLNFSIVPKAASANLVSLKTTYFTYNGKVKKPGINAKVDKSNYTVTYPSNGYVGKKTVKIKFRGNYKGTVSKTYTIIPQGTKVKSLKKNKKSVIVKWKKQRAQVTGYQVQYSTSKKFTAKTTKTATVRSSKTTAKTIKGLRSKKKYYVRIRTYKTANRKNYYSTWSKVKSVKTK